MISSVTCVFVCTLRSSTDVFAAQHAKMEQLIFEQYGPYVILGT